jgi:hypothetical protein
VKKPRQFGLIVNQVLFYDLALASLCAKGGLSTCKRKTQCSIALPLDALGRGFDEVFTNQSLNRPRYLPSVHRKRSRELGLRLFGEKQSDQQPSINF